MTYRGVGFHQDVIILTIPDQVGWRVANVSQNLVDHGFYLARGQYIFDVFLDEVRKSDGPKFAGLIGFLEGPPCFAVSFVVTVFTQVFHPGFGTVNDHQIYVVESQGFYRSMDRLYRFVVRFYFRCQFGGYKKVISVHSTFADTQTNSGLILISLGGINMPVT